MANCSMDSDRDRLFHPPCQGEGPPLPSWPDNGDGSGAAARKSLSTVTQHSSQSTLRRHSLGDDSVQCSAVSLDTTEQYSQRRRVRRSPSPRSHHRPEGSNHRSISDDQHPLEMTRMSSIMFNIDETKGVTLSPRPPMKSMSSRTVVRKRSMDTLAEDPRPHCRRPSLARSVSDGNLNACHLPSRVPLEAIPRYESQRSLVSELTGKESALALQRGDLRRAFSSRKRRSMIEPGQSDHPNNPHYSLEFPLLYFWTKHSTYALKIVRHLIQFRWTLAYPLQKRVPFSKVLRKMNIFCTWGELLLMLPFFTFAILGACYSLVWPSVSMSGHAARTPLIFAFCTAMRNSFLTLLIGIPFERALWYHKLSARLAYVNGLLHTYVCFFHSPNPKEGSWIYSRSGETPNFWDYLFADEVNVGGTLMIAFMTLMVTTALPYVRHKVFEVFYNLHVVFAASMITCAFFHTGVLVPIAAASTWGFDLVVRRVYMAAIRYPQKAQIRTISETVVEVCFPKADGFDYNPGQYIYIAVPDINFFQWHPFSLSSSPEQKAVTLHIRKAGAWTTALYDLAAHSHEINIMMEGPYGSLGVDLMSNRYKMAMLFSGGIGVTPMQAICNQLMYEQNTGRRDLKRVSMIWIERDPNVMSKIDAVRRTSQLVSTSFYTGKDETNSVHSVLPQLEEGHGIASTLLALVPPSATTDQQLEEFYPDTDEYSYGGDTGSLISRFFYSRRKNHGESNTVGESVAVVTPNDSANGDIEEGPGNKSGDDLSQQPDDDTFDQTFLDEAYKFGGNSAKAVLDLQVYLTAKNNVGEIAELPFIRQGRPDIKEIFRKTREEAIANGESRVAVCVCAPQRIVNLCQKASAKFSDSKVSFEFHHEVFD